MTVASGELVKSVVTGMMPGEIVWQAVFYHVLTAAAPVAFASVLGTIVDEVEAMYNTLNVNIKDGVTLEDVICHVWEYAGDGKWETGELIGIDTLTDAFNSADDMFPHAVAGIITGFTPDVKVRSRKSIPGLTEDTGASSVLGAITVADLVDFAAEWLTERVIAGTDTLWPVVPAKDGTAQALLHMLVTDVVGSQRQRKPGEGI